MNRKRVESVAGAALFITAIAANVFSGGAATIKVLGVGCIVAGISWIADGTVGVGIEGRPPSFYLGRPVTWLAGLSMVGLGLLMLIFSSRTACVIGWSAEKSCN
jgi:hypothetical protein